MNFDDLKLAVEALSGGRSTVLFDENMGTGGESFPSIMVRIPKFLSSDVLEGAPETAHPMFMVEGAEKPEIYISKYQNMVMHGRAYSLPFKVPAMGMTFDEALTYSEAKGHGWHLMTNAEYAGIMLWCVKNGFLPRGNYQSDLGNLYPHEKGVIAYTEDGMEGGVIATGSGPSSWTHDGTMGGICDLSGNLWEWASGLRLYNGEFQVIPDNNAALPGRCGDKSTYWRAILQDGSLAAVGTETTMKLDSSLATSTEEVEQLLSGVMRLNTDRANRQFVVDTQVSFGYQAMPFGNLAGVDGVTIPVLMQLLGLAPVTNEISGYLMARNYGTRYPVRGGSAANVRYECGVCALNLKGTRGAPEKLTGFRAAYVALGGGSA